MIALFRVQQEEDEKFDHDDLCIAEVQQTTRPSSPRRKRRQKRNTKRRPTSTVVDSAQQSVPKPISVGSKSATKNKELASLNEIAESKVASSQTAPANAIGQKNESVSTPSNQPKEPSTETDVIATAPRAKSSIKHNERNSRSSNQPQEFWSKTNVVETVDSPLNDEDTTTEACDDEVAKFRARLETIQSSVDRPKINICAGVFAKQLAAKKSAARARATSHTSFSI